MMPGQATGAQAAGGLGKDLEGMMTQAFDYVSLFTPTWLLSFFVSMDDSSTTPTLLGTLCLMLFPMILSSSLDYLNFNDLFQRFMRWCRAFFYGEEYERVIEHKQLFNKYGYEMDTTSDERNSILQKALTRFVAKLEAELDMPDARVSLQEKLRSQEAGDGDGGGGGGDGDSDDDDDEEDDSTRGSVASQLKKFNINIVPPAEKWVVVQKSPKVEYMVNTKTKSSGGGKSDSTRGPTTVTTTVFLRSRARSTSAVRARSIADKAIQEFVQKAYRSYVDEMRATEEKGRYMYTPLPKSSDHWKRYKLSEEKSFRSLFFPQKNQLLKLIEAFNDKTGKFAIQGYPHKLGLLLHGPPGTGKTSLIKALAQHTGRSIVSIPLARIKTNQQVRCDDGASRRSYCGVNLVRDSSIFYGDQGQHRKLCTIVLVTNVLN